MNTIYKAELLQKRRWRIRKKVVGTALRPRLSVKFTGQNIYAQAINDDSGVTLVFVGQYRRSQSSGGRVCIEGEGSWHFFGCL
jgi:large subunit ribosomal protein L18